MHNVYSKPVKPVLYLTYRMVWETNASVVVVLGDNEDKNNFWPQKGDYQLHPAVIMGEWYSDSLYIRTDKVTPTSSVEGLFEVAMVMHSYDDDVTEHLTLFHYSTWPQNGERRRRERRRERRKGRKEEGRERYRKR